jgi:NAD(P)-dependent dehydrogenase (short-subunit alcohol dehydrogenase family)
MMSTQTFLVIGTTGKTGRCAAQYLLERGHAVRAMVHKKDERSEALRGAGAEVVMGEVLEHDDVIRAAAGTGADRDSFGQRRILRTRPSGRRSRSLQTCRRFLRGKIPRTTPRATTGLSNVDEVDSTDPLAPAEMQHETQIET